MPSHAARLEVLRECVRLAAAYVALHCQHDDLFNDRRGRPWVDVHDPFSLFLCLCARVRVRVRTSLCVRVCMSFCAYVRVCICVCVRWTLILACVRWGVCVSVGGSVFLSIGAGVDLELLGLLGFAFKLIR